MLKDNWIEWKRKNLQYHGKEHAEEYAKSDQTLFNSPDHVKIRKWILYHLKQKQIKRLLDLGCGTGREFSVMKNQAEAVVGVDFSRDMLNKAKEVVNENKYANLSLIQCDIFYLPLKGELFDCVVSVGVLAEHAPLNDEMLQEVRRVMKKNASFLFTAVKPKKSLLLKIKIAQSVLHLPLPNSLRNNITSRLNFIHTRVDHNKRTIKNLLGNHGFHVDCIEVLPTRYKHYFVTCILE